MTKIKERFPGFGTWTIVVIIISFLSGLLFLPSGWLFEPGWIQSVIFLSLFGIGIFNLVISAFAGRSADDAGSEFLMSMIAWLCGFLILLILTMVIGFVVVMYHVIF